MTKTATAPLFQIRIYGPGITGGCAVTQVGLRSVKDVFLPSQEQEWAELLKRHGLLDARRIWNAR